MESSKITLKSRDGYKYETTKTEIKQLRLLTTMLEAYEDYEVTEPLQLPLQLDGIDGAGLQIVMRWCKAFPNAEQFSPDLDRCFQTYRRFDYTAGEESFLEQYQWCLWAIADAADYLDASRLKFCALQYLSSEINNYLSGSLYVVPVRRLLGFPCSMKGKYRQTYYGARPVLDKELSKALSCQLFRFATDYRTLQNYGQVSPDWERYIITERQHIPLEVVRLVTTNPRVVNIEEDWPYKHLSELCQYAISELAVSAWGRGEESLFQDFIDSASPKLRAKKLDCSLHYHPGEASSGKQCQVLIAFLRRVAGLHELKLHLSHRQLGVLARKAAGSSCPPVAKIDLTIEDLKGNATVDAFELFVTVRKLYDEFAAGSDSATVLLLTIRNLRFNFQDLLEIIGNWFAADDDTLEVKLKVHLPQTGIDPLIEVDNLATANGYREVRGDGIGKCYACERRMDRKMMMKIEHDASGAILKCVILKPKEVEVDSFYSYARSSYDYFSF
ncbi:hypothetical protein AAVH_25295 [Aphelenchoides avenae]|nr:hypothetical protein AAVH_25295 [Aphelenchus avenae]